MQNATIPEPDQNTYYEAKLPDSISLVWHIDDILSLDDSLTDDEAREILQAVEHGHDASIGVNWDTLEYYIDDFKRERDEAENANAI